MTGVQTCALPIYCQAHAAILAQVSTAATPERPATAVSVWQRWGLRWLVPAGAVALLALWVVWPRSSTAPVASPAAEPEGVQARLEEQDPVTTPAPAPPTRPSAAPAPRPEARGNVVAAPPAAPVATPPVADQLVVTNALESAGEIGRAHV